MGRDGPGAGWNGGRRARKRKKRRRAITGPPSEWFDAIEAWAAKGEGNPRRARKRCEMPRPELKLESPPMSALHPCRLPLTASAPPPDIGAATPTPDECEVDG